MEMTHDFPAMLAEAMAVFHFGSDFLHQLRKIDRQPRRRRAAGRDNGRPILAASRSKYFQILRKYQELEELVGVFFLNYFYDLIVLKILERSSQLTVG